MKYICGVRFHFWVFLLHISTFMITIITCNSDPSSVAKVIKSDDSEMPEHAFTEQRSVRIKGRGLLEKRQETFARMGCNRIGSGCPITLLKEAMRRVCRYFLSSIKTLVES